MMQNNIRAIRLVLTNIILFLLTWYYQVPQREWSLITVWFVMFDYSYVGGVWIKSTYRFLGTILSSLYGLTVVYFFYNNVVINILAFIPAIFIYIYFFMDTEKSYMGTIGCVTLAIVLLNHNDIDAAILRTFNIFLGILASLFMMRFFYPQYARDSLIEIQAQCLEYFQAIFESLRETSLSFDALNEVQKMNQNYLKKTLADFKMRIKEAKMETFETPEFVLHHQKSMDIIEHISQLLSTLMCATAFDDIRDKPDFQRLINGVLKQVDDLILVLKTDDITTSFVFTNKNLHDDADIPNFIVSIFDIIQKEMNHWYQELIEIMPLYQIYVKSKPFWIKKMLKEGYKWLV